MNHNVAHCLNYCSRCCPSSCPKAQLENDGFVTRSETKNLAYEIFNYFTQTNFLLITPAFTWANLQQMAAWAGAEIILAEKDCMIEELCGCSECRAYVRNTEPIKETDDE